MWICCLFDGSSLPYHATTDTPATFFFFTQLKAHSVTTITWDHYYCINATLSTNQTAQCNSQSVCIPGPWLEKRLNRKKKGDWHCQGCEVAFEGLDFINHVHTTKRKGENQQWGKSVSSTILKWHQLLDNCSTCNTFVEDLQTVPHASTRPTLTLQICDFFSWGKWMS